MHGRHLWAAKFPCILFSKLLGLLLGNHAHFLCMRQCKVKSNQLKELSAYRLLNRRSLRRNPLKFPWVNTITLGYFRCKRPQIWRQCNKTHCVGQSLHARINDTPQEAKESGIYIANFSRNLTIITLSVICVSVLFRLTTKLKQEVVAK